MSNIIHYIVDKNVATITTDNSKVNAVSFQFAEEVNAALGQSEKDQTEAMIGHLEKFPAKLDLYVLTQGGEAAIRLTCLGDKLTVHIVEFPTP